MAEVRTGFNPPSERRRRGAGLFFPVFVALCLGVSAASEPPAPDSANTPPPPAPAKPEYLGSDTCASCHEEVAKAFWKTKKGIILQKGRNEKEKLGCEACHGPGSLHPENAPENILRFKKAPAAAINDACLSCHAKTAFTAGWKISDHSRARVACTDCHTIHPGSPGLLKTGQPKLCTPCHKALEGQMRMPSRHPLKEGKVLCTDCHNPHAKETRWNAASSLFQPCVNCHQEKVGPFKYEHRPVAQNCLACHRPHGSPNQSLLSLRMPSLCLECHTLLPPSHRLLDAQYRTCTNCHEDIHGSNRNRRFFP